MVPINTTIQNNKKPKKANTFTVPFPDRQLWNGGHIIQIEQVAILKFIFCITQEYLRKVVGRWRKVGNIEKPVNDLNTKLDNITKKFKMVSDELRDTKEELAQVR